MHQQHQGSAHDIALDYIETVNANIELFLKDKTNQLEISIETAGSGFTEFWGKIGAEGKLGEALKEWDTNYNAS